MMDLRILWPEAETSVSITKPLRFISPLIYIGAERAKALRRYPKAYCAMSDCALSENKTNDYTVITSCSVVAVNGPIA